MSDPECIVYDGFRYCDVSGIFMFGDNTTKAHNAVAVGSSYPTTLFIPRRVEGHAIQEVGKYALSSVSQIKQIIIEARITKINDHGFSSMAGLEYIKLPNTLEVISSAGIHMWNLSLGDYKTNPGTVTIAFEPKSKLNFIASHGISYKENVNIILCNSISPILVTGSFAVVEKLTVFSPYQFFLNGTRSLQTNFSSYCATITLQSNTKHHTTHLLYIFILFS